MKIFFLALAAVAMAGDIALTTECPNGIRDCATLDSIRFCVGDEKPQRDTSEGAGKCCPTCKPCQCTDASFSYSALEVCATAEVTRDATTCCPTCKPPATEPTCPKVDLCAEGTEPSKDTNGCPTCIRRTIVYTCETFAAIQPCAEGVCPVKDASGCPSCLERLAPCADAPTCPPDTKPVRTDKCCLSCKPAILCTDDQIKQCYESVDQGLIRECATDEKPAFQDCCRSCLVPRGEVTTQTTVCTADDVKTCRDAAAVCADGQEPLFSDRSSCCRDCVPPSRLCAAEEVASCRAALAECAADVKPVWTEGECCPSCRPPRPRCDPVCGDGQLCVPNLATPERFDVTCKKLSEIKLAVVIKDAAKRARAADFSREAFTEYIREVVDRFCDKRENADRCQKFADLVKASIVARVTDKCRETDDADVNRVCLHIKMRIANERGDDVDVAADGTAEAGATKRADSTDTSAKFMIDSVSAPEANDAPAGSFSASISEEPGDKGTDPTDSGAAGVIASAFVIAAAAIVA